MAWTLSASKNNPVPDAVPETPELPEGRRVLLGTAADSVSGIHARDAPDDHTLSLRLDLRLRVDEYDQLLADNNGDWAGVVDDLWDRLAADFENDVAPELAARLKKVILFPGGLS